MECALVLKRMGCAQVRKMRKVNIGCIKNTQNYKILGFT